MPWGRRWASLPRSPYNRGLSSRAAGRFLPAVLLALACTRIRSTNGDPVVLSLGSDAVRRSEFERHVAALEKSGGAPLQPDVRRALLQPFLEERVVVLEARRRGLVAAGASSEDERRAVQRLLAGEAMRGIEVTDAEIGAYFQAHPDEFRQPERVAVRQILVPTRNEARDVRRRVLKDTTSFDVIARSRSRSPEASTGGMLGVFERGQLPRELDAAAFALAAGETSDVVETPLGFHVLRVEAREPERQLPLEECRARIRERLLRDKSDQSVRAFVRGLLAQAKVDHAAIVH
jgi:peptidyl-prolyl cis-trans isomerase C